MGKEAKAKAKRAEDGKGYLRFHITDLEQAVLVVHFLVSTIQKTTDDQLNLHAMFDEFLLKDIRQLIKALPPRADIEEEFDAEQYQMIEPAKSTVAYVLEKTSAEMQTTHALLLHDLRERMKLAQKGEYVAPGEEEDRKDAAPDDAGEKAEGPSSTEAAEGKSATTPAS